MGPLNRTSRPAPGGEEGREKKGPYSLTIKWLAASLGL